MENCDHCSEIQRECPGEDVHCIVYGEHCDYQDASCASSICVEDHPDVCCICKEKL